MKTKYLLLAAVIMMFTALKTVAQNAMNTKSAEKAAIPFGKKLPPPNLTITPGNSLPGKVRSGMHNFSMQSIKDFNANDIKKDPARFKQQVLQMRDDRYTSTAQKKSTTTTDFTNTSEDNHDFHVTKDINSLAESYPSNSLNPYQLHQQSYAVLNNIIYFAADDGVHGTELWRSDGTDAGTYLLKDIAAGNTASFPSDITAANGKLYFDAYTSENGYEPWVSDGTSSGTQLLMDVSPGTDGSFATEFIAFGNSVYFVAGFYTDDLWKTDGTAAGTKEVAGVGQGGNVGYLVSQLTTANNLLFFTFLDFNNGWQLWRSDGTTNGTYNISRNYFFPYVPAQLTKYNNELYFSADDGTGRKLWMSDGTDDGTKKAANDHGVIVYADYFGIKFPVLNNVLYIPSINAAFTTGALYKYDASNNDGMVKVKGLVSDPIADYVVASEMQVVHNMLYYKVTSLIGGLHDELWSSGGDKTSTQRITKFTTGETISNLYDGTGTLYFVKYDKTFGAELWKLINTFFGSFPIIESDNFNGATSSYPAYLTAFKDKLFFSATDGKKGNELLMTNAIGIGATVVKDINTTSTSSSYAGEPNYVYITPFGNGVVFDAVENVHGDELYKSNGTAAGTILLNDIIPGELSSGPNNFSSKNNAVYFIATTSDTTIALFKTDGTKAGLQKIASDINTFLYYPIDFKVANNSLVFYVVYNFTTGEYELWRTDGTNAGTFVLSYSVYYSDYLNVAGNTAFFAAGDNTHGYELWKSDGSIAGTKMVKDINHGSGSSYPGGIFVYNNEVYFGANDGTSSNGGSGAGFWKSDGTDAGTIKLKAVDPWWGSDVAGTDLYYFEAANNELYFAAINYANAQGTKLWKTDGTPHGTVAVKDITADAHSYNPVPVYFTNVNGTIFFIGNDDVNGSELWKTDGTEQGTQLVKDIAPGANGSSLTNLVSYAGKLYFTNNGVLWSSDGTENGTQPVSDAIDIYNVIPAGNKLFISGYTWQYGVELYEGEITDDGKFVVSQVTNSSTIKTTVNNILLYPNPARDIINITFAAKEKMNLQLTNIAGKMLINKSIEQNTNNMQLNISQLAAGTYFIKLVAADGTKTSVAKFEKQ